MYDNTRGGNDTLIGGDTATNTLYGDAYEMHDDARGGNDTLTGGGNRDQRALRRRLHHGRQRPRRRRHADRRRQLRTNTLYGDAYEMHDNARGGDDTLTGVGLARPTCNLSMAMPSPCTTTAAAAMTR